MTWSDTMTVEVGYEIEEIPTEEHTRNLRWAAESLTDEPRSIRIRQSTKGDRHVLVVTFRMRKMAQYKVVGDISHKLKLHFGCFHSYLDTWIAFPKDH